jgi:hypothetical protein
VSTTTLILGAGASRSVSYARKRQVLSPLDSDFFELLQKIEPSTDDETAVSELIQWILTSKDEIWNSMERAFYTLYMRAQMSELLFPNRKQVTSASGVVNSFTRATSALLRRAHGKQTCANHVELLSSMGSSDAVVTFNYDLVAERAIKNLPVVPVFGKWLYGFGDPPIGETQNVPVLYKLHGSMNWIHAQGEPRFAIRQESWKDFDEEPGYRAHSSKSGFAIMLPYWDKKIEEGPWGGIWKQAAAHLKKTERLIVWGYSLPLTDLKAFQLLNLSFISERSCLEEVCVIDPSANVRNRWRAMFPAQRFWPYERVQEFLKNPPRWWS